MKKIWLIGWKDVTLAFRDRAALVLMLAAPFALTLGLGFVTGSLSGSSGALSKIPVLLVNEDGGLLGRELVSVFQSADLADLVAPDLMDDAAAARQRVDADEAAAAVIIPAGWSESVIRAQVAAPGDVLPITIYANPTRPTSAGVIRAIVDEFAGRVEAGRIAGEVVATQLAAHGLAQAHDAARIGAGVAVRQANAPRGTLIALRSTVGDEAPEFDALAYMAPGMALMFLMFTASYGGRTLLAERAQGTLSRLLVSPTSASQVLGGKVLGIYLTGVAQMLILIGASTLLFRLSWGDPLGVLVLVLAAVLGATGWGLLITALAKTPGQVSAVGSAVMLTFGILGGSFINPDAMPRWFQVMGKITPNAWGLDGFSGLAMGGGLADIVGPVTALPAMGALLFAVALLVYSRRGLAEL